MLFRSHARDERARTYEGERLPYDPAQENEEGNDEESYLDGPVKNEVSGVESEGARYVRSNCDGHAEINLALGGDGDGGNVFGDTAYSSAAFAVKEQEEGRTFRREEGGSTRQTQSRWRWWR